MRIPRRTVSIGFLSLTALALGGVLFAQNAPDKSADNTPRGGAEPIYGVGRDVSPPRPTYTLSPEVTPGGERGEVSGYSYRDGDCGGDVTDAKAR